MMFYEFFMSFIMFYPLRFLSSPGDFLEFGLDCCGMRWDVLLFFFGWQLHENSFSFFKVQHTPLRQARQSLGLSGAEQKLFVLNLKGSC